MVNGKYLAAATGLAVAAIAAWFLVSRGDAAEIKKCFRTFSAQVEKSGREHELIAAAKAQKIETLFAESAWIYIPAYDMDQTFTRAEISPRVLYTRAQYREISCTFSDLRIRFPEKDAALVALTGELEGVTAAGERVAEVHELECEMKKTPDGWRLSGIRGVAVAER